MTPDKFPLPTQVGKGDWIDTSIVTAWLVVWMLAIVGVAIFLGLALALIFNFFKT